MNATPGAAPVSAADCVAVLERLSDACLSRRLTAQECGEFHDACRALRQEGGWQPIETAPKGAPYWVVWSAAYRRPVVVTHRMDNNTYWEGDWDYDVEATHWHPALATPSPNEGPTT